MSNSKIHETIAVSLGARSYDIEIGEGLLADAGTLLKRHLHRPFTAVVTDRNVAELHLAELEGSLNKAGIAYRTIVLEPGETTKSFVGLQKACEGLLEAGVERKDTVVALGGGVIGDLAGFAASILRRGVKFIQIPTTLLAQVDSSVGGKTGINSPFGKNLIGSFHQPQHVLADLSLLKTLPQRQLAAGYAEVVKYGLLGDEKFFHWLEEDIDALMRCDTDALAHAVTVSCRAKATIVAEDETETGVRALLNLGHTFGHVLEAATGYSDVLLHGEAVSIGMVQAFSFSEMLGYCHKGAADRVAVHLAHAGLPTRVGDIKAKLPPPATLVEMMRQDKKASAGKITFILVRGIGEAFIARDVRDDDVLRFLEQDMKSP